MFREGIMLLVPVELETKVSKILDSITYLLRRYFIGLIIEILVVMILITVGLLIVGLKFNQCVVIGLICGLLNIIPYLGPWIGAAIGLLIGAAINVNQDFTTHTFPVLIYMTIVFVAVQMIDNMVYQPFVYSSSVKAHPLEVFFVFMIAGSVGGILGMILAVPVYTIARVIAKEFFDNMKLVRKLTENLDEQIDKIPKEKSD
jgi:predicted PurR-regulated permease PerM